MSIYVTPCKLPYYCHLIQKYATSHSPGLVICVSKELKVDLHCLWVLERGQSKSRLCSRREGIQVSVQGCPDAQFCSIKSANKAGMSLLGKDWPLQTCRREGTKILDLLQVNVYLNYWLPREIQNSWWLGDAFSLNYKRRAINPKLKGFLSSFLLVKYTSSIEPTLGHFKSITNKSVVLFLSLIERKVVV